MNTYPFSSTFIVALIPSRTTVNSRTMCTTYVHTKGVLFCSNTVGQMGRLPLYLRSVSTDHCPYVCLTNCTTVILPAPHTNTYQYHAFYLYIHLTHTTAVISDHHFTYISYTTYPYRRYDTL